MSKTVKVFEVVYDGPEGCPPGPNGDGTFIYRTRNEAAAKRFAAVNTVYGKLTSVQANNVPRKLARRWGLA